jgi:hypothetical protein
LEGLGTKDMGSCKIWEFSGILMEFWRVWSGSGPICNYFSATEGPAVIFQAYRDCGTIYNKLRGFFANFRGISFSGIIFQ